ncbi:AsnC family protein [Paenibacillus sp. MBLB4367]|uniref:AsnC family protein n=1 Tax=Paenibacillus sp. MBLB4367 TaxID=3384767 RepID=UPI003907E93D
MKPTHLETNKLDFFCIYNKDFDSERLFQVGKHERVEVKIHSVRFDELDRHILMTILNKGEKELGYDEVSCRIPARVLMNLVGLHETDLYERMRKYLSLWLETYTDLADSEFSLCSIRTLSENSKPVVFELTFHHYKVLLKYFNEAFIELLMNGIDAGLPKVH